ncbi:MAG: hypothetical protein P8L77_00495 [Gammaproteobacteria bacterium]|nr:hypothetical protein [Gammaproteobacteria bacterium]
MNMGEDENKDNDYKQIRLGLTAESKKKDREIKPGPEDAVSSESIAGKKNPETQAELARVGLAESEEKQKAFNKKAPRIRVFLYDNKNNKNNKKLATLFIQGNKSLRKYSNKYLKFLLEKKYSKIDAATVKGSFQIKDFECNTYLDLIDDIVLNSKVLEESKDVGLCFEFDNFETGGSSDKQIILGAQLSFAMKCRAVLGDEFKITFKIGENEVFSGSAKKAVKYVEACYKLDVAYLDEGIRLSNKGNLVKDEKDEKEGTLTDNNKKMEELNVKLKNDRPENLKTAENEIKQQIKGYLPTIYSRRR